MSANLSELFRIARQYGQVDIFTSSSTGKYSCYITFNTIEHTELIAKSGNGNETPEEAVEKAIRSAQEIVSSISKMSTAIPERKLLG